MPTARILLKEEFAPSKERVVGRFQVLLKQLGLRDADEGEVNMLMMKCNNEWKNLIVNYILYGYENFPEKWHSYVEIDK